MRARFKGKNGSMGFKHGKVYELKTGFEPIEVRKPGHIATVKWYITLRDTKSSAWCPYSSTAAVEENWDILYGML